MIPEVDIAELEELLPYMTEAERKQINELLAHDDAVWRPLPGPQTMAFYSRADVIGYGGAAGGGKTDLACGMALTKHHKAAIFRREGTQLTGIVDRLTELLKGRQGYNGAERIWRIQNHQIEFGSIKDEGDETKYQGRPKDLLVLDEATEMRYAQVRYLMGWVRTVDPLVHCQTVMTFNPPTSLEGRWVIEFFAPWLDPEHPCPAKPGELRWFAVINGKDVEVATGKPFEHEGERIIPTSRTFIPSRITDNPFLMGTNYMATLQALREPVRSQMLYGDFQAGIEDDPWQVIPTAWVDAAMKRWTDKYPKPEMMMLGVDVARGGKDNTIIAPRHEGWWFDKPKVHPGTTTPDGPTVAGLVVSAKRDGAPIAIDVIGIGASPYDFLVDANQQVLGVNVAEASMGTDKSGRLKFANYRSELIWQFSELLNPENNTGIALPPDQRLKADLCAFKWKLKAKGIIYVLSREEIIDLIGRSPDFGTAYILASIQSPKLRDIEQSRTHPLDYDPQAALEGEHNRSVREYDPLQHMMK